MPLIINYPHGSSSRHSETAGTSRRTSRSTPCQSRARDPRRRGHVEVQGQLVEPREIYETLGADALRATILFASPPEDDIDWADVSAEGMSSWLKRLWQVTLESGVEGACPPLGTEQHQRRLGQATHQCIDAVPSDYERKKYNIATDKLMQLSNVVRAAVSDGVGGPAVHEAMRSLILMLAPIALFITEEHGGGSAVTARSTRRNGRLPTPDLLIRDLGTGQRSDAYDARRPAREHERSSSRRWPPNLPRSCAR
jgi:hypothetical protein